MGKALQLVSGFVTNPGATITAVAALSGESLTVPAFTPGTVALLGPVGAAGATGGVARIRSPRFHDNAQGIRLQHPAGANEPLTPFQALQPIFPADLLTVELSGGGAETDMIWYLQHFDDLPGVQANLANWSAYTRVTNVLGASGFDIGGATFNISAIIANVVGLLTLDSGVTLAGGQVALSNDGNYVSGGYEPGTAGNDDCCWVWQGGGSSAVKSRIYFGAFFL
jgi:hypothetical protein